MKDDGFAEQFGGHWTFHKGRVVPFRSVEGKNGAPAHIIHEDPAWAKWAEVHVAFDYGYADPSVAGFWLVGPHQVILRRSIYETGLTGEDLVERVGDVIAEMGWEGRVTRMIGDPKKPDVVEVFRRKGLPIWDIDKRAQADRKAGHLELMSFLSTSRITGEPGMLIHSDNKEIIDEWSTLSYKDTVRDVNTQNAFSGGRDDGYDMARYFVMSKPPTKKPGEKPVLEATDFAKLRKNIINRRTTNQRHRYATVGRVSSSGLGRVGR